MAGLIDTYVIGGAELDENFIRDARETFSYLAMTISFGMMSIKDARSYLNATEMIDELKLVEKGRVVNDEEIEWIEDGICKKVDCSRNLPESYYTYN